MQMKKILMIIAAAALVAFSCEAKLKFKSFKATPNSCVVEMTDTEAGHSHTSGGAVLKNDGKEYPATFYECTLENGIATYRAVFPFQQNLRNATIILDINGKKVKKNIQSDILDYMSTNPYLR